MIAEKKQLQTLLALVGLLVIVGAYTYWTNRTPSVSAASSPAAKGARAVSLPSAENARIRLDLIDEKPTQDSVGRKNVFQYYVPPPPPKPQAVAPAPPTTIIRTSPPTPSGPPSPPPLPPSALSSFKYDGVGIYAKPGKMKASISDGPTNRYQVSEGEYILGRYRVVRITETQVEIEDVDQNRRQTYTRITQQ